MPAMTANSPISHGIQVCTRSLMSSVVLRSKYTAPCSDSMTIVSTPNHKRKRMQQTKDAVDGDVALLVERHAADNVGERDAKQERQRRRPEEKDKVPRTAPTVALALAAKFDRHRPQNQKQQHQHERHIKSRKERGIHDRETRQTAHRPPAPTTPRCRPKSDRCC